MKEQRAAARYARALLGLAESSRSLEAIDRDFTRVIELVGRHSEISHLVSNSTIALAEKEDFISKVFPSDIAPLLLNFIKVLIKKRRFRGVVEIQETFHRLVEKKQGIQEVEVETARPLSSRAEEKLRAVLEKKLRAKIRLMANVSPEMIGGMILRFDGKEINASFRDGLEEIRQRLVTSGI